LAFASRGLFVYIVSSQINRKKEKKESDPFFSRLVLSIWREEFLWFNFGEFRGRGLELGCW
jgi:hypothetical protein